MKYLLNVYYAPGIILGTGNIRVNKKNFKTKIPALMEHYLREEQIINKYKGYGKLKKKIKHGRRMARARGAVLSRVVGKEP